MIGTGCTQEDAASEETAEDDGANEADDAQAEEELSDYEAYIRDALSSVANTATITTDTPAVILPEDAEDTGKVVYVERKDSEDIPESVFISSSETPAPTPEPMPTFDTEPATSVTEPEPLVTPDVFDVGTGLIYIDGKYDTTYSSDLAKEINEARSGLNYPILMTNSSLTTCANLRAKEITCFLSHMRPDGSMFYSLAPQYYKAELIAIDDAPAKETMLAWMTDPVSKGILFSKNYTTFGVSNYVCNGLNCIVVSFGY